MFKELIGKKVKCRNLDIISFMYPDFVVIEDMSFKVSDKPFIYVGNSNNYPLLGTSKVPYIIISPNGNYDLDNRYVMMELAYKKNNIEMKDDLFWIEVLSWNEFFNIFKMFWVTGVLQVVEDNSSINLLNKVLENLRYPPIILYYYLKYSNTLNIKYFVLDLLKFIHGAASKNAYSLNIRNKQMEFYNLYRQNVPNACKNLLYSNIDDDVLRVYSFLSDLFLGEKGVYTYE